MKYKITRRRYIDSVFLLLVGIAGIIGLSFFIKPPVMEKNHVTKPIVSISTNDKFLYITNENEQSTINIFDINTGKTAIIATNSAQNIEHASLDYNTLLYLHGSENTGINIDTKKQFENKGDYISPDGKKFLSKEHKNLLVFSLTDEKNNKISIETPHTTRQLDKILGWSPDATNFYYTTSYTITRQTPMSATDRWMQKVGNEMKEMTRLRTWTKSSTSPAVRVFRVNTQTRETERMFTDSDIGVIKNAFYNNQTNEFYLINDEKTYRTDPGETTLTEIPLSLKDTTSIVFATKDDTNRFLRSTGKSLSLIDPLKGTEEGLFYATNSATVTPLALTGNQALFFISDANHFEGGILDIVKKTKITFSSHDEPTLSTSSATPIVFASWLKNIMVKF